MKSPREVAFEGWPYSNEHLHALKWMDLPWCTSLEEMPDSNGKLTASNRPTLYNCSGLEGLRYSVIQLSKWGKLAALLLLDSISHNGPT